MYQDFYKRISRPFRKSEKGPALLAFADKALVALTALGFASIALWLALNADTRLVRYLLVCAISFAMLTALRATLNHPRPYEQYAIDPLIKKDTQGKSFPSRHLFSASVISCAFLWLNPLAGICGFAVTALLGAIRIVGGVHFPKDVAAGIAAGIICGFIGFWLI